MFSKHPNDIKLEEMATEATESVVNMPSFLQQKTYRKQALYNNRCPLQISVPDLTTESVLKASCKALKIKLVKEHRPLSDLNDAWEYLHNYTMDM